MDKTPPSTATRAQAEFLLKEQKYDEALPVLAELIENNPSASEVRIYRMLVARILMLRHYSPSRYRRLEEFLREFSKRLVARASMVQHPAERLRLTGPSSDVISSARSVPVKAGISRFAAAAVVGGTVIVVASLYLAGTGHKSAPPPPVQGGISTAPETLPNFDEPTRLAQNSVSRGDSEMNGPANRDAVQIAQGPVSPDAEEFEVKLKAEPAGGKAVTAPVSAQGQPKIIGMDVPRAAPKDVTAGSPAEARKVASSRDRKVSNGIIGKNDRPRATTKEVELQYQSKQKVPIRESASFAAAAVQKIERGTAVSLLELQGSWAKVEIGDQGTTGFVRKEFLTPARVSLP